MEIVTSMIAGAALIGTKLYESGAVNDAAKIQKICAATGLKVKDGKETRTIQLLRRTRHEGWTEYAYRIPLGLAFSDFESKLPQLQDGLNHKSLMPNFSLSDLRELRIRRDIVKQIRKLLHKKRTVQKEIELSYDGVLKIRVHERGLPELVPFTMDMLDSCKGWEVPLGKTRDALVKHDFDKIAHMIAAGMTDMGKSNLLKLVITCLVVKHPKHTRLFLIDLKGGLAFNRFRDLPQVEVIAKNPKEALAVLEEVQKQLNEQNDRLLEQGYEDVKEAGEPERCFIVVDEAADLDKDCQEIIVDIGRRGRAAGYRLLYATQYPTNQAMPSQLRQNIGARVCFKLQTEAGSRAVLDEAGAEQLPLLKGRAIYQTNQKSLLQTVRIENEQIDSLIKPIINIRPRKEQPRHAEGRAKGSENGRDTLQLEAVGILDD